MKAVGIKALKNNLSRYLKQVQAGEILWVTDRDEVIAEIHKPTIPAGGKLSYWEAWLNQQERAGKLRRAMSPGPSLRSALGLLQLPATIDVQAVIDDTRADRV